MHGDLCILSASGSAVVLESAEPEDHQWENHVPATPSGKPPMENHPNLSPLPALGPNLRVNPQHCDSACFHIPYNPNSVSSLSSSGVQHPAAVCMQVPFPMKSVMCQRCRAHKVPEMVFSTVEPPNGISTLGPGTLINAQVSCFWAPAPHDCLLGNHMLFIHVIILADHINTFAHKLPMKSVTVRYC